MASGSTGKEEKKKKKKKKKGKTVTKRKRRRDRYESQNYLLRIEGTLCCASLGMSFIMESPVLYLHSFAVCACILLLAIFIVFLICGIWSRFDPTATTESVKEL
ncbi:hypothetical protein Y032_1004g3363 [Ancylostoma ceylanicum]|uniref:Uncharacterized protein n=1 Tax=Ancylostoma ceylanicum TaxID=53326 RepID=A0A016W759_9BILA|nr:hypothetical protein Y032_1004g3363 [Ancylostoma ceylanicum]